MSAACFQLEPLGNLSRLYLCSEDGTNRLTRACVEILTKAVQKLSSNAKPLVICGNARFFSVGADLDEIAALTGAEAHEFSLLGQTLMTELERFPAPVFAAIEGHCMGGGFDIALACHRRIAAPHAVFGHRGAALGLMTGWGGTQRLPRVVGKAKALELFLAAEKVSAGEALRIGLVDVIAEKPVAEALRLLETGTRQFQISDL